MKNPVKFINRKNLNLLFLGFCFVGAMALNANAQRDPFWKPVVKPPKPKVTTNTTPTQKAKPAAPTVVAAPSIQARIDGYKAVRARCAELGVACPKPTSVLTLDEMQITGVFRTPRGYAAMVEAMPIKLSYTIYPGEKFYDGQLVAIEGTKLVFRKVTRMTDGKEFVAAVDKILRTETINDMAATRAESQPPQTNPTVAVPANGSGAAAQPQGLPTEAVPSQGRREGVVTVVGTTNNSVNTDGLQPTQLKADQNYSSSSGEVIESKPETSAKPKNNLPKFKNKK